MRKLVTKRTISELNAIDWADRIEIAWIDDWQVIVKKGEFKVGDTCVFHEIGCFVPNTSTYSFLKPLRTQNGSEGFKIKTMKMKGIVSQGLALPLNCFSDFIYAIPEDFDLAPLLGVVKWEDDVVDYNLNCKGEKVSTFPDFIRKTDEERLQNLSKYYNKEIKGKDFYVTLKLHGSSCTVYYKDGRLGVCSRNQEIEEIEGNAYWRAVRESGLDKALIDLCTQENTGGEIIISNLAIQCELVGPKINGNMNKFDGLELYAFNIWDIDHQRYWGPSLLFHAGNAFNFKTVPLLGIIEECEYTIPELLAMAEGPSINCDYREGIVFKRADGKFSFKAISKEFLLKEKD